GCREGSVEPNRRQLGNMCADAKLDEWKLVLDQFHALVREGSDNIEDIFVIQFRRRFSRLKRPIESASRSGCLRVLDLDPGFHTAHPVSWRQFLPGQACRPLETSWRHHP